MRRKIHILVIDSEGLTRDGLCALLEGEDGLHLLGAFAQRARGAAGERRT